MVDEVNDDLIKVTTMTSAAIPERHLSDDPAKCEVMRGVIREKDKIVNAIIVFSKSRELHHTDPQVLCLPLGTPHHYQDPDQQSPGG